MKYLTIIITTIILLLITAKSSLASVTVAETSAQLIQKSTSDNDHRETKLRLFLNAYDSPLAKYSSEFVKYADQYNLDWRLVASIAGVESTFGKAIPAGSYNAYGWANGAYGFKSWEESIKIVSETLRKNYLDRGAQDIDQIARIYAPPSTTWAWKVKFFMNIIDPLNLEYTL